VSLKCKYPADQFPPEGWQLTDLRFIRRRGLRPVDGCRGEGAAMRPANQQQQQRLGEGKCGQNDSEMCHQLFA